MFRILQKIVRIITDNAAKETLKVFKEYEKDDTSLYKILNQSQYSKLVIAS